MRSLSLLLAVSCAAQTPAPAPANLSPAQTAVRRLFQRNIGTPADLDTAFEPHKVIGNIYFIGTRSLGSFLVTTPQGHILINTDYERTVPTLKAQVEKLGFQFTDVKIILGSHAHASISAICEPATFA